MNTHKASIQTKLKGSLTDEQKQKLNDTLTQVDEAITALETSETEATMEQILAIFAQAVEAIQASNDNAAAEMEAKINAELLKLQAKIVATEGRGKKFNANLRLKHLRNAPNTADGFKPYSAGVDVSAWTDEAEIENIEVFHPLIGVVQGFEISTISKPSLKVRGLKTNSGAATVVLNHAAKPVIELIGSQAVVNVATYAGVVEGIADEDLEDNPTLEAEIQQEALIDLGEAENVAAVALLEAQGTAFANASFGTKDGADSKTAIAAIVDQVRQALGVRQSPISLALNSSQWALLNDLRNDNGTPIDVASVLGDVVKIVDNSLTTDKFYCWAQRFTKKRIYKATEAVFYKGVKTVGTSGSYTAIYSEWRTDESSLRVRVRQVMYTQDATTIVKGTISGVITAITPS